jgi:hypothetical protein
LELVLACSCDGQEAIEIVLGEPREARAEVVFENGLPQLRRRSKLEVEVVPWPQQPPSLPLTTPGSAGEDRLRLRFNIDDNCSLTVQVEDLRHENAPDAPLCLGSLR